MADIRCPMCGKPNPADAETCQYCQARLKPLIISSPEEPQKPPSQPPGKPELGASAGAGDWLSDFRSGEPAEPVSEEGDASSASSDFGDWFSRLEEPAAAGPETPTKKPLQSEEQALPDWMSEPKETPAPGAGETKEPDWLQDFHAQAAEEVVPGPEKSDLGTGELGGADWLSSLGGLSTPAEGEAGQAEPATELPDWMKPEPEPGAFPQPSAAPEESVPDWMRPAAEPGALKQPPAQEESILDWMKPEPESGAFQQPAAAPEESVPDWMKPESEPSAFQQPAASQESVPDWMREVGGKGVTDELYGIEGAKPIEPMESTEPTRFDQAAGFGESGRFDEPAESAEPAAEPGEMPDWLKAQMPPSGREEISSLFPESAKYFPGTTEEPTKAAAEESGEDWFSKFGIAPEEKPAGATPAFVMSDDDMTPFVSGDEMAASDTISGGLESLPDWLSQVHTEQPAPETPPARAAKPTEEEPQAEAEAGLAPAQLPTWLEAMRPVESAAPATPQADVGGSSLETAGPLAGLRGVLPAEADITRMRKPPVYSIKLQVSEAHQARVSLLEELVAAEGQPKPVAPHIGIVPQNILRLTIALVLILAVVGALWMGGELTSLPDPKTVPQELDDLRGQIEALSANAQVLVAFDYDPGFSGEMEPAAAAVISHLVEKRVPLMAVSTNPLGPALANRLLTKQVDDLNSQLLGNTVPYTTSLFSNLGYIPGGIAGLRAFAQTPTEIFPRSLENEEIWTTAPLTTGATLSGFSLALVITDNPDTARAWIEQAEPVLRPKPLVMVVSAQAEPLIYPYYSSGQVKGLVSGLAGGAAYENKSGISGLASQYWDAFSLSLLVVTILILIGGLVNAFLASTARSKRKGEEQPYA